MCVKDSVSKSKSSGNSMSTLKENGSENGSISASGCDEGPGSRLPSAEWVKEVVSMVNEAQCLERNLSNLQSKAINGAEGLARLLVSDAEKGVEEETVEERGALYGRNSMPASPRKSWWQLFADSFDDTTVQILILAAVVSLAVGMYEDPLTGYVEGLAILAAVLVVSVVTAFNDYQKETQFRELSRANEAVDVLVVRGGRTAKISNEAIVVGDVVKVEAGDRIPCDGVLLRCDGLQVDESALTGEPVDVEKSLAADPFLLSGCTATHGSALFCAVAVGKDSQWGKIKAHLDKEQDQTPLQEKLDHMALAIGHLGMAAAAATFLAMMLIKIYVDPPYLRHVSLFSHALDAFIIGVTIVVVAVPEGLPLAVTISLAYSTKKMLNDNNLIRHLAACETMGNATNICSDKTGTLTENRMTVVKGVFANANLDIHQNANTSQSIHHSLSQTAIDIILQCIATCSTATILHPSNSTFHNNTDSNTNTNPADTRPQIIGNKTEGSLLLLANSPFFQNDDHQIRRANANFGQPGGSRLFPFSSSRKRMSVLVKQQDTQKMLELQKSPTRITRSKQRSLEQWFLYHKGAAETVLDDCTQYLDTDGSVKPMTDQKRTHFQNLISEYASQALRCVVLAHRTNIDQVIDPDTATAESCAIKCERDLILDALVGIADPLRPDVVHAVQTCQNSGIFVRMVTGDNLETAKAIAREAGILTHDGISMIGEDFRKLTPAQLDDILPRLQVLARSSPEDKHILVQRLNGGLMPKNEQEWLELHPGHKFHTHKDLLLPGYYDEWAATRNGVGEVVGVTGDGTNDGPALKAADVGLSMGISGTDVAKNASDIIIMDDNFSSIVKAVLWGRSVFDNIRKFLQFQLTVNVVALTITFISAVAGYKPPLNAVMMLWVNLIMDTMGALALGTEPPTLALLNRHPYRRDAGLINLPMWRNIFVQATYQLGLLIFLLKRAPHIFGCEDGSTHHFTIIFNAFVFCQVFNEFNAREIGDVFNPFARLGQSPMFLAVIFFTIIAQWGIVEFGGDFTQTYPLTMDEWKITCMLGALSIPFGYIMRLIPIKEDPHSFAGNGQKTQTTYDERHSSALGTLMIPLLAMGAYQIYELNK